MGWLTAAFTVFRAAAFTVFCIIALAVSGCVIPFFSGQMPADYSGATAASLIVPFLENDVRSGEGVLLEYNPNHGDSYAVAAKSCSGTRCILSLNFTTYYISIYDKVLELEAVADYVSGLWAITNYTIISEKTVGRQT